jgi:hypothetical protein
MAIATRASGVCDVGEVDGCSQGYTRGGRLGSRVLLEQGRYNGFRPEDVTLGLTDSVCAPVVDSQCTNITRLIWDCRRGRFAATVPPRQRAQ